MPIPALPIHVLHIGKTGGTALKHALRPHADRGLFVLHRHPQRLRDCPPDATVFVVVRDPVDRFVSGFNSRLRRGRPRYDVPWTRAERLAFRLFPTADALATALASRNPLIRLAAGLAMRGITHVGTPLSYWLESPAYLAARRSVGGAVIVGTLDTLATDLARLLALAGVAEPPSLPADPVAAHTTPAGMATALGPRAVAGLRRRLAGDIALWEHCRGMAPDSWPAADNGCRAPVRG